MFNISNEVLNTNILEVDLKKSAQQDQYKVLKRWRGQG